MLMRFHENPISELLRLHLIHQEYRSPPKSAIGTEPDLATHAVSPACLYNSNTMDTGLKNRVAIVAASSQGIGRATAEALAAEGCRVAMCARNAQTLQAAAERIAKQSHVEV